MVNNINNNTISEADAKQKLNALNEIKKTEIKGKRFITSQKILLKLFDELIETIFNNNVSVNKDNNDVSVNEDNNENEDENEHGSESDSKHDDDDEQYYKIKQLNNYFKMIDARKPFEEQIEILKKKDFLNECWHDDKELNIKIFKVKVAYFINDLDEQLFEKIFGHTFVALADKLINTRGKEENRIFINDIKKIEIKFTKKMILVIS